MEEYEESARYLLDRITEKPVIGIICGSGEIKNLKLFFFLFY